VTRRDCASPLMSREAKASGCPDPFRVGISQLPIDALPKISDLGEGAPTGREGETVLGWALDQSSLNTARFGRACGPRILCEDSECPHPAFGHPPPTGVGGGRDLRVGSSNSHLGQPEVLPQSRCPDPFRVGNHLVPIDALSELASGRVAEGREGPHTTQPESKASPIPTPRSRRTPKGHDKPSIDALSELASGRVAKGREGPQTTQLRSRANPFPTLQTSGAESQAKREVAW